MNHANMENRPRMLRPLSSNALCWITETWCRRRWSDQTSAAVCRVIIRGKSTMGSHGRQAADQMAMSISRKGIFRKKLPSIVCQVCHIWQLPLDRLKISSSGTPHWNVVLVQRSINYATQDISLSDIWPICKIDHVCCQQGSAMTTFEL